MQHDAHRAIYFTQEGPSLLWLCGLPVGVGEDHLTHGVSSVTKQLHHVVFDDAFDPVAVGGETQLLVAE